MVHLPAIIVLQRPVSERKELAECQGEVGDEHSRVHDKIQ
jgi:hypothetical protein